MDGRGGERVGVKRGWREKERGGGEEWKEKHQWLIKWLTSGESEGGWWRIWARKKARKIIKSSTHYFCVHVTNKTGVEVAKLRNTHCILNWVQAGSYANGIQVMINFVCVCVHRWVMIQRLTHTSQIFLKLHSHKMKYSIFIQICIIM